MLYLAIPAQNEVATIGVLLWRLRTVLAEFPREYEVVVYDDASTDETAAVAEQYLHAMPVTVLRGAKPVGYAGAVDALVRHVANHTRYPRRDAMLLLQGDFTDPPGIVPEFARRFEGGADLVVGERTAVVDAPTPVRRLFTASGWALRPFVRVDGVRDLTGSMRLMRISALRDLLRTVGDEPVCAGDSWTANADLLLRLIPHARRVESVPLEPTYGVRTRDTRRVTMRDALAALRWGWRSRGRRAELSTTADGATDTLPRQTRASVPPRRRDESEVTVDRLRERSREHHKLRGDVAEPEAPRGRREGRPDRKPDRKPERSPESNVERSSRENARAKPTRDGARDGEKSSTRHAVSPTTTHAPSRARPAAIALDADVVLDDPFAAPSSRTAASRPRDETASATTPTPPSALDRALREAAAAAAREKDTASLEAPVGDESDDDVESTDAQSTDSADTRERKRRRNRRSRRRRSKSRGTADDTVADAAAIQSADIETEPSVDSRDGAANGDENARDGANEPLDATVDGSGHDGSGHDRTAHDASGDDGSGDDASGSRARRRGRRGRRGGSRRSRGRNRDGGESGAESGENDSGPPSDASTGSHGGERPE